MAVYLFTYHAYRSWNADHPRGYTSKEDGVLPPDKSQADFYDRNAKQPPVRFDRAIQSVLIAGAADVCCRRGWRLHASGTDPTHGHFLISWKQFAPWGDVSDKLKNLLSLFLGRSANQMGRSWFSAEQSRKRVTTRASRLSREEIFAGATRIVVERRYGVAENSGWDPLIER